MSRHYEEGLHIFKKTLALILTLGLVIALLNACSASPQQNTSPQTSADESSAPIETTASAEPSADTTGTALARGTWTDDVYSNDYAQLSFSLPEGWIAASDDDIAALMGQTAEIFNDDQQWIVEAAELSTIYDMMAQDTVTGNNILVLFENLAKSPGGLDVSEEDYAKIATEQMAQLESVSYTFDAPYTTTINGVPYLTVQAAESNIGFTQFYFLHRQDDYMVCVIASVFNNTGIDDILAQFK